MTNFEKWKDELEDLIKAERSYPAIVNGEPKYCERVQCSKCDLDVSGNGCQFEFFKWLFKEYKERQKLTKRQRGFLEALQTGWVARDKNGMLYFYEGEPKKGNEAWNYDVSCVNISYYIYPDFPFIKWEDDEPYSIEEMLTWEVEDGDE